MKENKISLKGILGGLQVYVDPDTGLENIKKELGQKLDSSGVFFKDTEVNLVFTGKEFDEGERHELVGFISQRIHVGNVEFNIPTEKEEVKMDAVAYNPDEGMTKFIKGTVRNGQRIDYQGNVIIMGDVNPGAEIVAGGNIIVLGNLRGMAHAGVSGDKEAIVIALYLQPTQLRIGNIITRSPEDETEKPHYPEIAYVKGNNLFIEPYMPGKIKY